VRIDLDGEGRIEPGKIRLLEKIREHGSISGARRAMNMSYKRASDRAVQAEEGFGHLNCSPPR
jgi:molybdate transport system regulatory protein